MVNIWCVIVKDCMENNYKAFAFEGLKTINHIQICIDEYQLEDNYICSEPILYNGLFSEYYGTGKNRLGSLPVRIGSKKKIMIVHPYNVPEVEYT